MSEQKHGASGTAHSDRPIGPIDDTGMHVAVDNLAGPTAQIAVMGAGGAVNILQRAAMQSVADAGGDVDAERTRLTDEYEEAIVNPWDAADRGYVDAVIEPSATRVQIVRALRALRTKRGSLPPKKHGNIPL